jgi:hypothetical protein
MEAIRIVRTELYSPEVASAKTGVPVGMIREDIGDDLAKPRLWAERSPYPPHNAWNKQGDGNDARGEPAPSLCDGERSSESLGVSNSVVSRAVQNRLLTIYDARYDL